MRWYKHLYVGQKAKKKRFTIIQNIRKGRFQAGVHVITPASCGENLMDIYPASLLLTEYYSKKEDLLILGIAADYYEALEVARDIVDEMYHTTGRFSIREFLSNIENSGIPAACHTGAYHSASSVCPSGPCQVPRTGIFL